MRGKVFLLPPPLWGRVGVGGRDVAQRPGRRVRSPEPPPRAPPHKGGGRGKTNQDNTLRNPCPGRPQGGEGRVRGWGPGATPGGGTPPESGRRPAAARR